MNHKDLIANEMHKMGFQVKRLTSAVIVSLKNRKVSQLEVRNALEQAFQGIEFNLHSVHNGVWVN